MFNIARPYIINSLRLNLKKNVSKAFYSGVNRTDRKLMMRENDFSPPINRSMRALDRSFFHKKVNLLVAYFPNPKYIGDFVRNCQPDILNIPSVKHIVPVEDSKGVLLRKELNDLDTYEEKVSSLTKEKINEYSIQIKPYVMTLNYDFWKADDILGAVLPENLLDEVPTGYAQAGHVAHLNLREEFKPYGSLIGQVILDKNTQVQTVVDKVGSIHTKFRTFDMKVLAGKNDLMVEQNESGCKFRFDFSKVYWNSRLSTEHDRLVNQFKTKEAVADVFAGVGPFAVPAGKKGVLVLANDLNPESYSSLNENITLNKTNDCVKAFNFDGREFIRKSPQLLLDWHNSTKSIERTKVVKRRKIDPETNEKISVRDTQHTHIDIPQFFTDYVMNLPDSALTFLDEFVGLYSEVGESIKSVPGFKLPKINVHCFEKFSIDEKPTPSEEELHKRVHARIVKLIDYDLPFDDCKFHLVRSVAPTKPMFCVTFTLPEEVAFKERSY